MPVLTRSGLLLALLGIALLGCRRDDAAAAPTAEVRARAVLAPVKSNLKTALTQALADGGPEPAIEACAVEAPRLMAAASKDGVHVGRAAARRRNPDNRVPAWATASFDELARAPSEDASRTVKLPDGRTGYVEAIMTKPLCLTCHGDSVAPAVRARIAARYPADEATGFHEGDLRGVFWVELPAASAR